MGAYMDFLLGWDGNSAVLYKENEFRERDVVAFFVGPNNIISWTNALYDSEKYYARNFLNNINYPYAE